MYMWIWHVMRLHALSSLPSSVRVSSSIHPSFSAALISKVASSSTSVLRRSIWPIVFLGRQLHFQVSKMRGLAVRSQGNFKLKKLNVNLMGNGDSNWKQNKKNSKKIRFRCCGVKIKKQGYPAFIKTSNWFKTFRFISENRKQMSQFLNLDVYYIRLTHRQSKLFFVFVL